MQADEKAGDGAGKLPQQWITWAAPDGMSLCF